MKKVIDWKLYNTETSSCIEWFNNWIEGLYWWREDLYKSKKGKYFIYWIGWPGTKYAQAHWSNTSWSEDIYLLGWKKDILEWIEDNSWYFSTESINAILEEIWEVEEG